MACCRYNRSGTCSNCQCARANRRCDYCLPSRLNKCKNLNPSFLPNLLWSDPESASPTAPQTLGTSNSASISSSRVEELPYPPPILFSQTDCNSPSASTIISDPDLTWGKLSGRELCDQISEAYENVVHWKRNVFMIPSGNASK